MTKKDEIRILSLDGGGIRGLFVSLILEHVEQMTGKHVTEMFDLVAGTSTGGIIGLALVTPDEDGKPLYSAADMVNFYLNDATEIFSENPIWLLRQLFEEKYPDKPFKRILEQTYKGHLLREALVPIIVPAYNMETGQPRFFKSRKPEDARLPMWKVARATAAAPSYFEVFRLEQPGKPPESLLDGSVVANNPSMAAYAEVVRRREYYAPGTDDRTPITMLSIGTGQVDELYPYKEVRDWGVIEWLRPLFDILIYGTVYATSYEANEMISSINGGSYYRVQPTIKRARAGLDDASPRNLTYIQELAQQYITDHPRLFDDIFRALSR